jgi:hypothetical protein
MAKNKKQTPSRAKTALKERRIFKTLKKTDKTDVDWVKKNKETMLEARNKVNSSLREQEKAIKENKYRRFIKVQKSFDGKPVYNPKTRETEIFKFTS